MADLNRNKAKYPFSPRDYSNGEIRRAVKDGGTIRAASIKLKVCYASLVNAITDRKMVDLQRPIKEVVGTKPSADVSLLKIADMTKDNRMLALLAMDRIKSYDEMTKMLRQEKSIHAAASGVAQARRRNNLSALQGLI